MVPGTNPASSALLMLSMFVGDVPEDCNKGERELIKLNREERDNDRDQFNYGVERN